MADSDIQTSTATPAEGAPEMTDKDGAGQKAAAETSVPPSSDRDIIRGIYATRAAAPGAEAAFSRMETVEAGRSLRGAYVARLSEPEPRPADHPDAAGDDVLRRAYVARIVTDSTPPRARRAAVTGPRPQAAKRAGSRVAPQPGMRGMRHKAGRKTAAPARGGKRPQR